MAILNQRPSIDTRKTMSGKDGGLFDQNGELMATVESFQAQMNVENAKFQPLGSGLERSRMVSASVTIKISTIMIESSKFIRDILKGTQDGNMPAFTFQGLIRSPYNGSEERIIYRQCVPDGSFDIQHMAMGEMIKCEMNFVVNEVPDMQSMITM